MNNAPTNTEPDDLFWLAVRYVGNDLSDAERLRFEERLASDVAACDALAEAARLTVGVRAALAPMPQRSPHPPGRSAGSARRRLWTPVIVTAGLLLATGGLVTFWQAPTPGRVEVATAELLSRWRHDGRLRWADDADLEEDGDGEADVVDESLAAPGWLVSAVRLTEESAPETP